MNHSNDTHLKSVGYILWIFGFTGSHRFYYGKPVTGTIWFFTLGLLFIGWIIDFFLSRLWTARPISGIAAATLTTRLHGSF